MERRAIRLLAGIVAGLATWAPGAAAATWAPGAAGGPRAVITSGPSAETTETTAELAFEASGMAPLSRFECSLDGTPWRPCTSPSRYDGLSGGPHEFAVRLVGPLTDPTPDRRRWVVVRRTEIVPPPPPPPVDPPRPTPPRPPQRRDAKGCAYAANRVGETPDRRLTAALMCLINAERAERGLAGLHADRRLARAAERHSRDMVGRAYFAHVARDGSGPADRIRRTGYLRRARAWTVGETLAWGTAGASAPREIVAAWMRSRPHRAVLLGAVFREAGMGIARGIPIRGGRRGGGTFAAAFGHRD